MKVAFDHQVFSFQRYGGISRYFVELASRLPAHGVSEVSIVAPVHINDYLTADSARRFTRGKYVPDALREPPSVCPPSRPSRPYEPVRCAAGMARSESGHRPRDLLATKPVGKGRRRILTVYDMIHELFSEEFPDAEKVTAAKRAAVNRADHIICISENTRRDLVRLYGIDPARARAGSTPRVDSLTAEANAAKVESGGRRPSLLYVGNRLATRTSGLCCRPTAALQYCGNSSW